VESEAKFRVRRYSQLLKWRRTRVASPINPVPSNARVPDSGLTDARATVVAKADPDIRTLIIRRNPTCLILRYGI